MSDGTYLVVAILFPIVLVAMRWAHRNWTKAFLATLFVPLVAVPMSFVSMIAMGLVLRIVNAPLKVAGFGFSNDTLGAFAGIVTALILSTLFILHIRDQRHLSTVETGPRFGLRPSTPEPNINLKRKLR